MASDKNRASVRRWVEALNKGDVAGAVAVLAPDYVGYFSAMPEPVRGPEGFAQMFAQ